MEDLFKNKYRISSARLQSWDYANEAKYFITICTAHRECFFGKIIQIPMSPVETQCIASLQSLPPQQYQMQLSEIGKIAQLEWMKTSELRPDMNLELGEFIVMPNHVHGIIIIGVNQYNQTRRDAMHCVSTTTTNANKPANKFGPQSKNIAALIRGYKSAVTAWSRKNNIAFDWQARFHDHIIRSESEYYQISNYILNNPNNWKDDKFYK
jgi:putative transposase